MAKFMDVHTGFIGVTAEQLEEAHGRDLAIESDEGVHRRAWLDPGGGSRVLPRDGALEGSGHAHPRAGRPSDRRGLRADGRGGLMQPPSPPGERRTGACCSPSSRW